MNTPGLLGGLYLALLTLNYLSFWYSSLRVFKKSNQTKNIQWYILRVATLLIWYGSFIVALFWGGFNNNNMVIFSCAMSLSSLVLFWFSARHIKGKNFLVIFNTQAPQQHQHTGPYRYIRHPFYTSYILCYLSLIPGLHSRALTVMVLFLTAYYYWAAKGEEAGFANSPFSESYSSYKKTTGMFLPKLFK